jgi:hypothetical protein
MRGSQLQARVCQEPLATKAESDGTTLYNFQTRTSDEQHNYLFAPVVPSRNAHLEDSSPLCHAQRRRREAMEASDVITLREIREHSTSLVQEKTHLQSSKQSIQVAFGGSPPTGWPTGKCHVRLHAERNPQLRSDDAARDIENTLKGLQISLH